MSEKEFEDMINRNIERIKSMLNDEGKQRIDANRKEHMASMKKEFGDIIKKGDKDKNE